MITLFGARTSLTRFENIEAIFRSHRPDDHIRICIDITDARNPKMDNFK